MYCSKCGLETGSAKFCTACGAAVPALPVMLAPPAPYPPSPESASVKNAKMDPAKRTKTLIVIGWVMLVFGAWRFIANIAGLILYGEPSIFDYSIFDNSYAAALQGYRLGVALAVIAIILYLAMMIAGLAIIIVNRKKAKDQK